MLVKQSPETLPKDKIFICGLELIASIGVSDEERAVQQPLLLDMTLTVDIQPAIASDEIEDAVDYDTLSQLLKKWALERPYKLIEALANHLAEKTLLNFPNIEKIRLKLHKFPPLPLKSVGVIVVRSRVFSHPLRRKSG